MDAIHIFGKHAADVRCIVAIDSPDRQEPFAYGWPVRLACLASTRTRAVTQLRISNQTPA